ncbi:MAG: cache domain-containing protein, partial [Betaproteobacteria bacterium]
MHLSLRGRIVGLISAIFILVLGLTSWVDIQVTRSNLLSIQDQRALLISQPILKDVERLSATMQLKDLAYLLTRHSVSLLEKHLKDGVRSIVVIRRSDAVVLAHSDPSGFLGQALENADLKTAVQNPEINHYLSEDTLHSLIALGKDNEAVIDISWDRSVVDEPFSKRVIYSTIWFLVSSLIAALSASYFLKKILRQVSFPEHQEHGGEQNSLQRQAPTRTPKMKLVTKTILLVVSLLVLLFGTFSAIVLHHHERSLRESVLAGVDGMARANALTVSSFIADSMRSAEAITANLPIKAFQKGDFGAVNQYLREASLLSRFDNGIFILDAKGMLRADFPHHPEVHGTSFAYREYFIRTVKEKRGVISEPYESKRTGSPVLTFTRPVFDPQGQLVAVVACSMNLLESEALGQLLNQKVFNYGYLFLFDKSRLIIIHPDIERVLKRDIPEGSNDLLDRAINGQEGVGETVNSRGMPM